MRRLTTIVVLASALGGCQSIFGHRAQLDIEASVATHTPVRAEMAIAEGRELLRTGQPGLAIVVLQEATGVSSTSAEAYNMFGVAYASLGRGDLAERFFQKATAQNPDDPKYAANLTRFYRSRDAALAKAPRTGPVAVAAAVPESHGPQSLTALPTERIMRAGPGVVRVANRTQAGAMNRISDREVAIRTAAVPASANPGDGRRANPHFAGAAKAKQTPAYPLRIELDSMTRDQ